MNDKASNNQKPFHVKQLVVTQGNLSEFLGEPFKIFTKYVKVFDLYFVSTASSPDCKLLHGASILYQYIDNDDDGIPDNELVYDALVKEKATMVMFANQKEFKRNRKILFDNGSCDKMLIQDLQADETRPGCLMPFEFDASLEECFHLVTVGYSLAYPETFGIRQGSAVSRMMDCARGGYFRKVPHRYPDSAWFTYYDRSCRYGEMIVEYIYWAMTTILGAQDNRREEIYQEWKPCSGCELEECDNEIYTLLKNPIYRFPERLPVPLDCVPLHIPGEDDDSGSTGSSSSSSDTSSSSSDEE